MRDYFFYADKFYHAPEDFVEDIFDDEDEINDLEDGIFWDCYGSTEQPLFELSSQWITERIDEDRFSENGSDNEYEKIHKILEANIDYEKINSLIPRLYYENRRDKFKITKEDLLNFIK